MFMQNRFLHSSANSILKFSLALLLCPTFLCSVRAAGATNDLLQKFLGGPMNGVDEVVFAARKLNPTDGHWYANFGHYGPDADRKVYREGTKLYRYNLRTRQLTTLLADPAGGVRDPQVHYDGKKLLFSYRKGGTPKYLLYEMNIDGTGLKQLTEGTYD